MNPEEYLIKRVDGDWFDVEYDQIADIFRPISIPSDPVEGWGTHRIKVDGVEISFSNEIAGIQICFETDELPIEREREIVEEIAKNIELKLNQKTQIIEC